MSSTHWCCAPAQRAPSAGPSAWRLVGETAGEEDELEDDVDNELPELIAPMDASPAGGAGVGTSGAGAEDELGA